jgi:CRP-like cAMP-binding protein
MDRSTDLHILSHSEIFRGLSADGLEEVRGACFRKKVTKGETVFRQDDPVSAAHLVVAGRLRVTQTTATGQQFIFRYVGAGELAGYDALSGGATYSASVTAIDDTVLMSWPAAALRQLMARHSQIAFNALAIVESRYQELQVRLREVATETVERRIAHTVLRLTEQAGRRTAAGIEIAIPLSRQDIAEMVGTTLHTVSRIVSAWESGGIVDSGRRRLVVRMPDELARLAGEESRQPSPRGV